MSESGSWGHSVLQTPALVELHLESSVEGGLKICANLHGLLMKMAAMPINGKNFQSQKSFKAESCNSRLGMGVLTKVFK